MRKGNAYRKRRGRKPQKKMSTRELAKRALRKANELEGEEETKWLDLYRSNIRMRAIDQWTSTTTMPLTDIYPLFQSSSAATAISSYKRRLGAAVHISGVYLNLQFSWPTITNSLNQRYPPFARIKYAVVLQKKNELAVAGGDSLAAAEAPVPQDVYQNNSVVQFDTDDAMPIACQLFKSMKNGHNYRVLAEGDFTLSAPVCTNTEIGELAQPGTVGQPLSQVTTLGDVYNAHSENVAPHVIPNQYSTVTAKTVKIRLHPNCTTRFMPAEDGETVDINLTTPLQNGIYFMTWTDMSGPDARFVPPTGATWVYQNPVYWVNSRTRFKDS